MLDELVDEPLVGVDRRSPAGRGSAAESAEVKGVYVPEMSNVRCEGVPVVVRASQPMHEHHRLAPPAVIDAENRPVEVDREALHPVQGTVRPALVRAAVDALYSGRA